MSLVIQVQISNLHAGGRKLGTMPQPLSLYASSKWKRYVMFTEHASRTRSTLQQWAAVHHAREYLVVFKMQAVQSWSTLCRTGASGETVWG